jgi:hypothetical protein
MGLPQEDRAMTLLRHQCSHGCCRRLSSLPHIPIGGATKFFSVEGEIRICEKLIAYKADMEVKIDELFLQ